MISIFFNQSVRDSCVVSNVELSSEIVNLTDLGPKEGHFLIL